MKICECKKGTAPSQVPPNSGPFYTLSIFYLPQDYGSFWVNKQSVNQPDSITAAIKLRDYTYQIQHTLFNQL